MTRDDVKPALALAKAAITSDCEGLKGLIRSAFQEVLEAHMTEADRPGFARGCLVRANATGMSQA